MPVADTLFHVNLMRRDSRALRAYAGFEQQGIALSTSAITAMKLDKGAYVSKTPDNPLRVRTLLELLILLPVDEAVYEYSAGFQQVCTRQVPRAGISMK